MGDWFFWVRQRSGTTIASNSSSISKVRARSERRCGIARSLSTCASAETVVDKRRTWGRRVGAAKSCRDQLPQIPRLNSGQDSLVGTTVIVLGSTMICSPRGGLVDRCGEVSSTKTEWSLLIAPEAVAAGKGYSGHGEHRCASKCDFGHFCSRNIRSWVTGTAQRPHMPWPGSDWKTPVAESGLL